MKNLQEDIKTGNFRRVYLLCGDEAYLKIQYKDKLIKALNPDDDTMNFSKYEGKGIEVREMIDLCETMPFFADYRVILVENSGFFKNKCDELADYIKTLPDYVRMVLWKKKWINEAVCTRQSRLKGESWSSQNRMKKTLMRWAAGILGREGRKITTRDMEFLLTKTGTDMGNIRNELEKLITFTMGRDVVTAEDIEEICTTRTENKIFEMVRAVTEKNQRKALDLYNDLLTLREPPMRILFLLSKQFRQMTLAKKMSGEGAAQSEIASRLGVPSFVVRNLLTCARAYSTEKLEQAEVDFVDSEEAVKTGRLQDVLSVELLIVKYSTGR